MTNLDAIAAAAEVRAAKRLAHVETCCMLLESVEFDDAEQRLAKTTCLWSLRALAKELADELGMDATAGENAD